MKNMPSLPKGFNAGKTLSGIGNKNTIGLEEAIEKFIRYSVVKNLKETTLNNYRSQLTYFREVLEEEGINTSSVREIAVKDAKLYQLRLLQRGLSHNSVNTYILACTVFWNFLIKKGYAESNIFSEMQLKINKREKFTPTPKQFKKLFDYQVKRADTSFIQYRNLLLLLFLADTGARVNEAVYVKREDINLSEEKKEFVILNNTKNGESRKIGLSKRLVNLLEDYLELTKNLTCDYLFVSQQINQLSKREAQRAIKHIGEGAGIPELSCHALRRYFISVKVNAGVPLPVLQRLVGHADVKMLSHYYALFSDKYLEYKDSGID